METKIDTRKTEQDLIETFLQEGTDSVPYGVFGLSPFLFAAFQGDSDQVERLLNEDVDTQQRDDGGLTALMWAARQGHVNVMKTLLKYNVNIDQQDSNGWTAFTWASRKGHTQVMQTLKEVKDVDQEDKAGRTPLMHAAYHGHLDPLVHLINNGSNVNHCDNDRRTSLMCASQQGHFSVVQYLIFNNAIISAEDRYYQTALAYAAVKGFCEIVKELVEFGADINCTDSKGYTPLVHAAKEGHLDIVLYLLECGPKLLSISRATEVAALEGHVDVAVALARHRKQNKPRFPNVYGLSLLSWTIISDDTDSLDAFMEMNVSLVDKDEYGDIPIIDCARHNKVDALKKLLSVNKYVPHVNAHGQTALEVAKQERHCDIVDMLESLDEVQKEKCDMKMKSRRVRPRVSNISQSNYLLLAAKRGHWKALRELLRKGVNPARSDQKGKTALHYAATANKESVEILLSHIHPDVQDKQGTTPLHLAVEAGNWEATALLLKHGASNMYNKQRISAARLLLEKARSSPTARRLLKIMMAMNHDGRLGKKKAAAAAAVAASHRVVCENEYIEYQSEVQSKVKQSLLDERESVQEENKALLREKETETLVDQQETFPLNQETLPDEVGVQETQSYQEIETRDSVALVEEPVYDQVTSEIQNHYATEPSDRNHSIYSEVDEVDNSTGINHERITNSSCDVVVQSEQVPLRENRSSFLFPGIDNQRLSCSQTEIDFPKESHKGTPQESNKDNCPLESHGYYQEPHGDYSSQESQEDYALHQSHDDCPLQESHEDSCPHESYEDSSVQGSATLSSAAIEMKNDEDGTGENGKDSMMCSNETPALLSHKTPHSSSQSSEDVEAGHRIEVPNKSTKPTQNHELVTETNEPGYCGNRKENHKSYCGHCKTNSCEHYENGKVNQFSCGASEDQDINLFLEDKELAVNMTAWMPSIDLCKEVLKNEFNCHKPKETRFCLRSFFGPTDDVQLMINIEENPNLFKPAKIKRNLRSFNFLECFARFFFQSFLLYYVQFIITLVLFIYHQNHKSDSKVSEIIAAFAIPILLLTMLLLCKSQLTDNCLEKLGSSYNATVAYRSIVLGRVLKDMYSNKAYRRTIVLLCFTQLLPAFVNLHYIGLSNALYKYECVSTLCPGLYKELLNHVEQVTGSLRSIYVVVALGLSFPQLIMVMAVIESKEPVPALVIVKIVITAMSVSAVLVKLESKDKAPAQISVKGQLLLFISFLLRFLPRAFCIAEFIRCFGAYVLFIYAFHIVAVLAFHYVAVRQYGTKVFDPKEFFTAERVLYTCFNFFQFIPEKTSWYGHKTSYTKILFLNLILFEDLFMLSWVMGLGETTPLISNHFVLFVSLLWFLSIVFLGAYYRYGHPWKWNVKYGKQMCKTVCK